MFFSILRRMLLAGYPLASRAPLFAPPAWSDIGLRFFSAPKRRRRRSKTYAPNGKREVARRLRQIEAGQLQVTRDHVAGHA